MSSIDVAGVDEHLLTACNWLRRWGLHGGSVQLQPDGSAIFGWPEYDLSSAFGGAEVRPSDGGDDYLAASRAYSRQTNALLEDLQATPGGAQAVKDLLRILDIQCFAKGIA